MPEDYVGSVKKTLESLGQAREFAPFAKQVLKQGWVRPNKRVFDNGKVSDHFAIIPTLQSPKHLNEAEQKLYDMVVRRFLAMFYPAAEYLQTTRITRVAEHQFKTEGKVLQNPGWLAVYGRVGGEDNEHLPAIVKDEKVPVREVAAQANQTKPPPRYTEATLVKELEEKGIGRPSTYATIISTIVEREYVTKDQGRFTPTLLGEKVSGLLVKSFEDIFDVGFTARMEEELDEIEEGKLPWRKSVKEFYDRFEEDLEQAKGEMESYKAGIPTSLKCEKCGAPLLERISRHGFFLGCSRYPECDYTRDISPYRTTEEVESESGPEYCPNCGREMTVKRGRFGPFLACTGYPECRTTRRLVQGTRRARQPDEPLDEKCPECGSQLVRRHGRYGEFIGCSAYPKCKYIRAKTLGIACPKCGTGELVERMTRKGRRRVFYGCNRYPECDFTTPHLPLAEPCPKCGAAFIVEKKTRHGSVRACLKEGCKWEAPAPEAQPAEAAAPAVVKS